MELRKIARVDGGGFMRTAGQTEVFCRSASAGKEGLRLVGVLSLQVWRIAGNLRTW